MCELVKYDIVNVSVRYCIVQLDDMKYNVGMKVLHKTKIIIQQNNLLHLHYFDENSACVNWVGYYIGNVSTSYCKDEINEIK